MYAYVLIVLIGAVLGVCGISLVLRPQLLTKKSFDSASGTIRGLGLLIAGSGMVLILACKAIHQVNLLNAAILSAAGSSRSSETYAIAHVSSVYAFLNMGRHPIVSEIEQNLGDRWKPLGATEYENLGLSLEETPWIKRILGCRDKASDFLLDLWGNQILIIGRKGQNDHAEFLLFSRGSDGELGTEDDVRIPWDAVLPDGCDANG